MLLLQYRQTSTGYRSKITKSSFFMIGRNDDARAELAREIELFSAELPLSAVHPQCRFPARFSILKRIFPLKAPVDCKPLISWKAAYGLSHVSVMYAAQYLSNPASVFGHSFFLLGSSKVDTLRQLTFNFAADIPEKVGGFEYAYKGLTGGFAGTFTIMPYYHRLHVYTNMENRSLWEYKLNLSVEERDQFVNYLWELTNLAAVDYHFLDENCASVLLWLLKAIRPGIDIRTSNIFYVAPAEIIQIIQRENLVAGIEFHPSQMERLHSKLYSMRSAERKRFLKIIKGRAPAATETSALVLDATIDHLAVERHQNDGVLPVSLQDLNRSTLIARSKLAQLGETPFSASMIPRSPDQAHAPMRFSLGTTYSGDEFAALIKFRPAIHGLVDREAGYLRNSALEFFEIEILAQSFRSPLLTQFTLINFENIRTVSAYDTPLSWHLNLAWLDQEVGQARPAGHIRLEGSIGFAADWGQHLTTYTMLGTQGRPGMVGPLPQGSWGPIAGILLSFKRAKFQTEIFEMFNLIQSRHSFKELQGARASGRLDLGANYALFLKFESLNRPLFREFANRADTGVSLYF